MTIDSESLLLAFKEEICSKAAEIDVDDEISWFDLSYGFFLARGATAAEAHQLATEARYTHQYWM